MEFAEIFLGKYFISFTPPLRLSFSYSVSLISLTVKKFIIFIADINKSLKTKRSYVWDGKQGF